jgi:hypothetical protein
VSNITQAAIDTLNSAFRADPAAVQTMFQLRRPCNRALADHPNILVAATGEGESEKFSIGLLGIINGIIAAAAGECMAVQVDEQGNILRFCPCNPNNIVEEQTA